MALAILVVDCDTSVQQRGQVGWIERTVELDRKERFGLVEHEAPIAVGRGDQRVARFRSQGERAADERLGPIEQLAECYRVKTVEDQHLCAVQKGGIALERR